MKEKKEKEHDLTYLYAALGAVAFFVAGVPILDAFGGWMSNLFGLQSVKLNSKAGKIATTEAEQESTHVIGFNISTETKGEEIEDE